MICPPVAMARMVDPTRGGARLAAGGGGRRDGPKAAAGGQRGPMANGGAREEACRHRPAKVRGG